MRDPFEVTPIRGKAAGDRYSDEIDAHLESGNSLVPFSAHKLDSEESRKLLHRLLGWYYLERDKQSANRLEMAIDADFYDGEQWDSEDAAILRDRGQMPLVFNEIAPMIDWLIGTERRMRVDWNVLPREKDDVDGADIKKKVLKYVSDVNGVVMARSRAFGDSVKAGIGWTDDGARDDPTKDILYSKYEDWRCVIHDSSSYDMDLGDARYLFRWRWVDEDVACMMFPDRADRIKASAEDASMFSLYDEDEWYLGEKFEASGGSSFLAGAAVDTSRRRVKLIECQYRMPVKCQLVSDGPHKGSIYQPSDTALNNAILSSGGATIVDRVMMRMHFAVFTETDLLAVSVSPYRFNDFTLTPYWCYRRSRDRLPYGPIRRVRSIQQDLNKRASKALFLASSNQVIAETGAVEDPNVAAEEAARPDGYIEVRPGKRFEINRDYQGAGSQVDMLKLDAQAIQKSVGINNENLGRQTNAISGAAIEARQSQGSVSTTEPFDNQLFAIQCQGRKMLSLIEQFYTEERVIRLTGAKGKIDWVEVNQPEQMADGTVRWLNDITARQADFVVSEQDYAGTLRQVMFDSLQAIVKKLPPEVGLKLYSIAMQYSDLPNADEIVEQLRKITGEPDPDKELSPEEQQKQMQNQAMQEEAMQMQREMALAALEEQKAKAAKLQAEAAQLMGGDGGNERGAMQVQAQADAQVEALSNQLRQQQADFTAQLKAVKQDADRSIEVARIAADARIRVAEIQQESERRMAVLEAKLRDMESGDVAPKESKAAQVAQPVAATPAVQQHPMNLIVNVDARKDEVKKKISIKTDADGNIIGADVIPEEAEEPEEIGGEDEDK